MFRMERKFHTIDKRCCATLGIATRDRKRDDPRMNLALSLSSSHLTERSTSVPRALCKTSRYCANASRRAREGEGKVFTPYRWIATIRCKHLSSIALMNVIITVHANESFPITEFDVQIRTRRLHFKPFLFFRRGVSAFVARTPPFHRSSHFVSSFYVDRWIYYLFSRFRENVFWIMEIFHLSIDTLNDWLFEFNSRIREG